MTAKAVISAFQAIEADSRLTNVDKLVLLRYAWKTPESGVPRIIRFKAFARELNCCPKIIKKSVFKLIGYGYLRAISIQVKDGPALKRACPTPQPAVSARGRGGPTPPLNEGGPTPPQGGSYTPPKGGPTPPLTNKKKKESEYFDEWLKLPQKQKPEFRVWLASELSG